MWPGLSSLLRPLSPALTGRSSLQTPVSARVPAGEQKPRWLFEQMQFSPRNHCQIQGVGGPPRQRVLRLQGNPVGGSAARPGRSKGRLGSQNGKWGKALLNGTQTATGGGGHQAAGSSGALRTLSRTWGSALWGLCTAAEGLLWECGDRRKAEQAARARWRGGGDSEPPPASGACVCAPTAGDSGGSRWGRAEMHRARGPTGRVSGGRSTEVSPRTSVVLYRISAAQPCRSGWSPFHPGKHLRCPPTLETGSIREQIPHHSQHCPRGPFRPSAGVRGWSLHK